MSLAFATIIPTKEPTVQKLSAEGVDVKTKVVARFERLRIDGRDVTNPQLRAATTDLELLQAMRNVFHQLVLPSKDGTELLAYIVHLSAVTEKKG